jgi:hypothetical protein
MGLCKKQNPRYRPRGRPPKTKQLAWYLVPECFGEHVRFGSLADMSGLIGKARSTS